MVPIHHAYVKEMCHLRTPIFSVSLAALCFALISSDLAVVCRLP